MEIPIARVGAVAILTALAFACGDNTDPTVEEVAGSYAATRLIVVEAGQTTDLLRAGASVELTLAEDGSSSGRLFIPGGNEDGSDVDESLVGTWSLTGNQVSLTQTADTFLRNMVLNVSDGRLTGERVFVAATVSLTLEK